MSGLTRIIVGVMLATLVGMPIAASRYGWGLGGETNERVVAASSAYCPPERLRPDGSCSRTVRSYYFGRSFLGGGPRSGT